MEEYFEIGQIVNTSGLKGEIKILEGMLWCLRTIAKCKTFRKLLLQTARKVGKYYNLQWMVIIYGIVFY